MSFGAFDIATGRTLPGVPRTDAEGRWQLAFLPLIGERVVRLVARTQTQTVVTLFTSTGRVISSPSAGAAGKYRLKALNPLIQNSIWWFGTFNPPPPPVLAAEIFTFQPLATLPGFVQPIWGWMQSFDFEACVLGRSLVIGPCGTT